MDALVVDSDERLLSLVSAGGSSSDVSVVVSDSALVDVTGVGPSLVVEESWLCDEFGVTLGAVVSAGPGEAVDGVVALGALVSDGAVVAVGSWVELDCEEPHPARKNAIRGAWANGEAQQRAR